MNYPQMATFSNNLDPSPEELLESMVTSLDETQEEGIDQMVEFNGHKTLNEVSHTPTHLLSATLQKG